MLVLSWIFFFGRTLLACAWQPGLVWRICGAAECASPVLDASQNPQRCTKQQQLRFNAEDGALCLDQDACSSACAARSDCHHVQMLNTGDPVCYLKPMTCEVPERWHFSPQYFALVKSQVTRGCPAEPKPMLIETTVSSSTSTPEGLVQSEDGLYVVHTPAPGALPVQEDGPSWSVTMTLHTPAPMTLAEKVFQSEPGFLPAAQGASSSEMTSLQKGRWPENVAPASQLTNPGDRWFAHLNRRCSSEGISQSQDLCLDHPTRHGFPGAFSQGYKAVCLDVNKCMALCDVTPGCFAVEMSQEVNRCELKGSDCLVHENWRPSDHSNLLVVGRLQGAALASSERSAANVSPCADSVVSRCPVEWTYDGNPGGFHCNRKLHYQTSEAAYLSSAGACRPSSAGPFPYDDCADQCRIQGRMSGGEGRVPSCSPTSVSRCPSEWQSKGDPGGFHCLQQLHYQYNHQAFLSSDGACRPAHAGPFPVEDCSDQCRIGSSGGAEDDSEDHKHARDHTGLEVLLDATDLVAKAATASAKAHLEALTSRMHFGMMDLEGEDADMRYKYSSIVHGPTAHCTLYLVPFNADNVGVLETASWSFRTVDISSFSEGEFKYSAGVLYGDVAFFAPYGADHVGVFDLTAERFGRLAISAGSQDCKYSGAIQRGSIAYFVPFSAENVGVLDMESRSFRSIAMPGGGKWKYRGGVLHKGKCYFAPHNADNIGVLDVETEEFHAFDISRTIVGDMKFTDAFVHNDVIFFVPFNADAVGALHLGKTQHFELVKIPNLAGNYKFWGSIQVGGLTYFVPDKEDAVGVFDAASREYTQVDIRSKISMDFKFSTGIHFNGILYFAPRDAPGIGMLQVGRVDSDLCEGPEMVDRQATLPAGVVWEPSLSHHDKDYQERQHPDDHGHAVHGHASHHDHHDHRDHDHPSIHDHLGSHHDHDADTHHDDVGAVGSESPNERYSEPRPSWAVGEEEQIAGKSHQWQDVLIALASIVLVLLPAEMSREKWDGKINDGSLCFLRSVVVATICTVCFFVVRSFFAGGTVAFWERFGPAFLFFVVLWFSFQVSLLLKPYERRTNRLDIVEILGYSASFAGVDFGGVYLRSFDSSCMEAAAALMVYQVVLLGLDALAGWLAKINSFPRAEHRASLLGPPALLSVEVLSFGLLGEFGQEMLLNRLGMVQDGTAPGDPAPSLALVLVLSSLSCIIFGAAQLLESRKAEESHQVASLAACWAAIRAFLWLAKLIGLPDQGSQLLLSVLLTGLLAQLLSVELPDSRTAVTVTTTADGSPTATPPPAAPVVGNLPKPLGIALGLLWGSLILRSTWLLVIVAVPHRIVYAQVHFMVVWLMMSLLVAALMLYVKARSVRKGYASVSPVSPLRRQGAKDLPSYERHGAMQLPGLYERQGAVDLSDASPTRAWTLNPFAWFGRGSSTPKSREPPAATSNQVVHGPMDSSDSKAECSSEPTDGHRHGEADGHRPGVARSASH